MPECQLMCSGSWQKAFNPLKANLRVVQDKCYGPFKMHVCRQCVTACPYDAIFIHSDSPYIFKCDLCNGGKVQLCVKACPRDALQVKEVSV